MSQAFSTAAAAWDTTLAESAYYRFIFWFSMGAAPVKPSMRSQHTLFHIGYSTPKGLMLQDAPFDQYRAELTHPGSYDVTQALGTAMRQAGVAAFEYPSARDAGQGLCVGLFTPQALAGKSPRAISPWLCETTASTVSFKQEGAGTVSTFGIEQFLINGRLATY